MPKYVVYSEMSEDGQDGVIMRVPVDEAIMQMMNNAQLHGHTYGSEDEALQDFIAVNWGTLEEQENTP
jgi:hypothetical protein